MKQKGFAPLIVIIILAMVAVVAYFSFKYQQLSRQTAMLDQIKNSPSPSADPSKSWKTYNFSPIISLKLPEQVEVPSYVNAGHYALETTLPGGTTFQIWGADGASPSGGQDYYDTYKQSLITNKGLNTKDVIFNRYEATEFNGGNIVFTNSLVMGGESAIRLSGILVKMKDGRALMILHYQGETLQKNGDFTADEVVFNQILSTFKFTDQNNVPNPDLQTLVTNFYSALNDQDGKTLFSLMTPAISASEKADYSWLTGADLGSQAFYRVFIREKIDSPKVTNIQKQADGSYKISLTDQFYGYSNAGDSVGYTAPQPRNSIVMTAVNSNGKWLVDKYTDLNNRGGNAPSMKYNGFGQ